MGYTETNALVGNLIVIPILIVGIVIVCLLKKKFIDNNSTSRITVLMVMCWIVAVILAIISLSEIIYIIGFVGDYGSVPGMSIMTVATFMVPCIVFVCLAISMLRNKKS